MDYTRSSKMSEINLFRLKTNKTNLQPYNLISDNAVHVKVSTDKLWKITLAWVKIILKNETKSIIQCFKYLKNRSISEIINYAREVWTLRELCDLLLPCRDESTAEFLSFTSIPSHLVSQFQYEGQRERGEWLKQNEDYKMKHNGTGKGRRQTDKDLKNCLCSISGQRVILNQGPKTSRGQEQQYFHLWG